MDQVFTTNRFEPPQYDYPFDYEANKEPVGDFVQWTWNAQFHGMQYPTPPPPYELQHKYVQGLAYQSKLIVDQGLFTGHEHEHELLPDHDCKSSPIWQYDYTPMIHAQVQQSYSLVPSETSSSSPAASFQDDALLSPAIPTQFVDQVNLPRSNMNTDYGILLPQASLWEASEKHGLVPEVNTASQKRQPLRRRERNRLAASKCRARKRTEVDHLKDHSLGLGAANSELKTIRDRLKAEVQDLKNELLQHSRRGCLEVLAILRDNLTTPVAATGHTGNQYCRNCSKHS